MTTDFTYGNKTITTSGPTKPATKNSPGDVRTRVQTYADISTIPMPYIGMPIVVLTDETNENKMTEYRVKSLKANTLGVQDTVVNEVVRLKDFLEISNSGNVSQEDIKAAVNDYFVENPVQSGATSEQVAQIEANKTAIGDSSSGLIKEVNDIKNTELQNLNTAILRVNETVGNKSELPSGDANVIASINRIDNKGEGLTTEQVQQLADAYAHSQTIHVSADDIPTTTSQLFNDSNFVTKSYVDSITVIPEGSLIMTDVIDGEVFSVLDSSSEAYGSIVLSTSSLSFNENSSSSFTVKLSQAPTNNQTVSIKVNNGYCTVDKSSLTFTSSDYSIAQTVTVTGVPDSSSYSDKSSIITLSSAGVSSKTVNVTINNIDSQPSEPTVTYGNIVLSNTNLAVNENASNTFTVKLDKAPTSNQVVNVAVDNSYCTVNPSSLTFTSSDYSIAQTVTVTGVHDNSHYSTKNSTITVSSANVSSKNITVTINNIDEQPSETVPVQGVTLNKPTHTMKVDETLQLTPVITPSNATNQEVTWETSNGNCTVVGGLVTATAEGECVITCKTVDGNKSDTCNVTVQAKDIVDTPSNELNPSIKNGLTHMYDFTKLTTLSTQSDDLIGNMNIVIPSEFAGDGYLIYKNKHMNCGRLLEDDFTSFLTVKYGGGNYTFYCGDKSLTNNGSKYGTITQPFEKYELRDNQYYVLCVKFDSLNKKMYSYANGELLSSQTSESIINEKNIYTSFISNSRNGENYNLLVYNRQLEDSEIYAVSGELKKEPDVSNVQNLSIKRSLKEYYNFNLTQGSEKSFNSLVGDNELLVTGDISGNNGLVLGTAKQSLESKYTLPFNRRCTYFLNTTIPSIATKGNKVIEFDNVALNLSKTSCSLKIGTNTSQSFTPIQNEKNIIAFTFDINSNQAKLYHNGVLKSTINISNYAMSRKHYYMLTNDLIHHDLVLFDDVLTNEEILTISNELRGV